MIIKTTSEIAQIIKNKRKEQNLTQIQLAQLTNVGVRFLSDLENAKPTCEIEKVLKILNNLGVKINID